MNEMKHIAKKARQWIHEYIPRPTTLPIGTLWEFDAPPSLNFVDSFGRHCCPFGLYFNEYSGIPSPQFVARETGLNESEILDFMGAWDSWNTDDPSGAVKWVWGE